MKLIKHIACLMVVCAISCSAAEHNKKMLALAHLNQRSETRNMVAGGVFAVGLAARNYILYVHPDQNSMISLLPLAPGALMFGFNYFIDCRERNHILAETSNQED